MINTSIRAEATCEHLKKLIREVPNFPKKGILFYDITTLLKDKLGFAALVDALSEHYVGKGIDLVLGLATGRVQLRLLVGGLRQRKQGHAGTGPCAKHGTGGKQQGDRRAGLVQGGRAGLVRKSREARSGIVEDAMYGHGSNV